ncbi:DUF1176 domain-containing protein [Brevundimonas guildfordensis]|uniref:DUF1176 domain-containing protein n=1 Tax=Brevundimonas guildfordensis TaxID=2762241 RepID=A0ABR8R0C5_9CAUL|nr:DUF1176 domain-containing protein [Brevundimonas guildfordensis]MBD7941244.1 DUF1176 domain-containing protein [Brevundimonas guildfordensis]
MTPRHLRFAAVALLPLALAACKGREAAPATEGPTVQPVAEAASAAPPAQGGANPPSVTREFREWTATCDNTNSCVAFGAAHENMGFVLISLGAGPDARPVVHMGGWGLDEGQGEIYAVIDGRRYAGDNFKMDEEGDVIAFTTPSAQLVHDLGNGSFMALRRGDEQMKVSLGGAAAAFLWIDERQGRLGAATALIRRGDRPASSVPAAPAAPRVTLAAAVAQNGLPQDDLSQALLAHPKVKECLAETRIGERFEPDVEVARLASDKLLWSVPCGSGAYNFTQVYFITAADGNAPQPVVFPTSAESQDGLVNSRYDPTTRTLFAFAKGRGLGDCGRMGVWGWTGARFALLEEKTMPTCTAMPQDLWPSTWRAIKD